MTSRFIGIPVMNCVPPRKSITTCTKAEQGAESQRSYVSRISTSCQDGDGVIPQQCGLGIFLGIGLTPMLLGSTLMKRCRGLLKPTTFVESPAASCLVAETCSISILSSTGHQHFSCKLTFVGKSLMTLTVVNSFFKRKDSIGLLNKSGK